MWFSSPHVAPRTHPWILWISISLRLLLHIFEYENDSESENNLTDVTKHRCVSLPIQAKSYSNSSPWMLVETTHVTCHWTWILSSSSCRCMAHTVTWECLQEMILLCNYEQCSHMSYYNTISVYGTSEAKHSVIKCAALIKINDLQ